MMLFLHMKIFYHFFKYIHNVDRHSHLVYFGNLACDNSFTKKPIHSLTWLRNNVSKFMHKATAKSTLFLAPCVTQNRRNASSPTITFTPKTLIGHPIHLLHLREEWLSKEVNKNLVMMTIVFGTNE